MVLLRNAAYVFLVLVAIGDVIGLVYSLVSQDYAGLGWAVVCSALTYGAYWLLKKSK